MTCVLMMTEQVFNHNVCKWSVAQNSTLSNPVPQPRCCGQTNTPMHVPHPDSSRGAGGVAGVKLLIYKNSR
jgi:hypothetical protein